MATLAGYFQEALTNIEPDTDKANAAVAHDEVSKALKADKRLQALGISPVLIGSYARSVSIKRVKDVDVFGRLENADETLAPGGALDIFEEVLSDDDNFGEDRVERQHRSLKVDFPDFGLTVDAVPARPSGDHWELPNRPEDAARAQWVETNPLKLNELTIEANKNFTLNGNGIYVPTVKLIRQIRRNWLEDQPGGFFFEVMTYWAFNEENLSGNSQAEYLALALEAIAKMLPDVFANGLDDPTMDGKKISTKAVDADFELAIEKMGEAAVLARDAFEDTDECTSAIKWRTLIGRSSDDDEIFPLPSYCNNDGTRKSVSSVTSGSTTVPAGNGRYA